MTSVVDAPRLVSSDASPTRPECAVTRRSRPAAAAAAVNRNPTICGESGTTRSSGFGVMASRSVRIARATRADGEKFGLLQHCSRRCLLFVRGIAVPSQHAFHENAEFRPDVFPQGPVDGDVASDSRDELAGNAAARVVAQHLHGAVVDAERVVEGELDRRRGTSVVSLHKAPD